MNKSKSLIALAISSLLLATSLLLVVKAQTPASTFWISSGIYPTDTFTVWNEGTNYYCKNRLGQLVFDADHTNASYVINSALAGLTAGRTTQETVRLVGNFIITHTLEVEDYTILKIDGNITLANNRNCTILTNADHTGDWYIDIEGGTLNGNKANQASAVYGSGYGVFFNNTQRWNIRDMRVLDTTNHGMHFDGTASHWTGVGCIESCYIHGSDADGMHFEVYAVDVKVSDCDIGGCANNGIEAEAGAGPSTIVGCLIWNNGLSGVGYDAIYLYNTGGKIIDGNRIDQNGGCGIAAFGDWNVISNNVIFWNSNQTGYLTVWDGIRLYNSTNSTVTGNQCFNVVGQYPQGWGIKETGSSNWNLIADNTCFLNAYGGITTVGANTTVSDCFNGTEWIGSTGTGATGPAGPAGTLEGQQPYDYLLFTNTTDSYMINGTTGAIDFNGDFDAVINNAIGNGTHIKIATGTHELTSDTGIGPITTNGVTIEGCGYGTVISCSAGFDDHVIEIIANYTTVKDLRIDGTNQASSYHGIYEHSGGTGNRQGGLFAYHLWVENCGSDGIRLGDIDGSWEGNWGKIHHCVIRNNDEYGIFLTYDATDSELLDLLISGHDGANDAGIRLECDNVRLSTSHLWGNEYELMIAESNSVQGFLCSNTIIADGGGQGQHRVYHSNNGVSFKFSVFDGCEVWVAKLAATNTYDGFSLTGLTYGIRISDTICRGEIEAGTNQGRYAIDLDASVHNCTFDGLMIYGFLQSDPIETTGASDITEGTNIVYDCG